MKKILKNLKDISSSSIQKILNKIDPELKLHRSKEKNIELLITKLKEENELDRKYIKYEQLGLEGKDGICYAVINTKTGKRYAMKTFRRGKTNSKLKEEYYIQKLASKAKIAPKIYDFSDGSGSNKEKYIVMERMENHLFRNKMIPTKSQQNEILSLFKKLDKAKIFYGDPNVLNFMVKNKKIYIIDYGFSKIIDKKFIEKHGENPNFRIMTINLILTLIEKNCPSKGYKYLLRNVDEKDKIKYKLP